MARIHYHVSMVNQQFSPVCWLACAAMLIQFKRGCTPSAAGLGQQGPDFRSPGLTVAAETHNNGEMFMYLRRLGFVVTRSSEVRYPQTLSAHPPLDAGVPQSSGPSEDLIYWLLQHPGPFILFHHVGAFWYGPGRVLPTPSPGMPTGEHAVVVTGLDTASHTVYFNNPWGDHDVPTTVNSVTGAIQRFEATEQYSIAYL